MKRFLIGLSCVSGLVALCVAVLAAQYVPKVPEGTRVGGVAVGGLTVGQAAFRLRQWWDIERKAPLTLRLEDDRSEYTQSISQWGLALDDKRSIEQVDLDSFLEDLKRKVSGQRSPKQYELLFKPVIVANAELQEFVKQRVPKRSPARVRYRDGVMERIPEKAGFALDREGVFDAALAAYTQSEVGSIPVVRDRKTVPDEELAEIEEVVSEYTTRFSEGKASRSSNIRLAAGIIDGTVLAPGESFSFNGMVGRRTVERGFKEAGVYKNGKHDIDIGGGICQVSSTLYNASLFANLKIVKRSNHSMPVPYVPLGRDATVDYGTVDLVVANNTDSPIALSATVGRGQITFRVLGNKDPETSVKLVSGPASSWEVGEKRQPDPSLPAGKVKVIEKGSRGHSVATYRVVLRNGEEIKRESLGQSVYRGGKRIVAVGTAGTPEDPPADASNPTEPPVPDEHDGV